MPRHQSSFEIVGRLPQFPQEVISHEINMWGATGDWVREHGGPIARAFVNALPESWQGEKYWVRCKLNWLKAGWKPGSGGHFHSDIAGRRPDGQFAHGEHDGLPGKHTIAAVVGDCSRTRFALGEINLPDHPLGQPQNLLYHEAILSGLERGTLREAFIEEGALCLFGKGDFHDTTPASHEGWRYFMRATLGQDPHDQPTSVNPRGGPMPWMRMRSTFVPRNASQERLFAPYRTQSEE